MNKISLLAAALLAAAPALAQAATMQAVVTGSVTYFEDTALTFGGQTAAEGDKVTVKFLYDPNLAALNYTSVSETSVQASGGETYGYNGDDLVSGSPIISATVTVGSASYTMNGSWFGQVYLAGYETGAEPGDPFKYYTQPSFNTYSKDGYIGINVVSGFYSADPSPLLNPTFEGPYAFDVPQDYVYDYSSYFVLTDLSTSLSTSFYFSPTRYEIALYDEPPTPAPVPLPAGAPLVLAGLGAMIGLRRLKRRA